MSRRRWYGRDVSSASLSKLAWMASRPGERGREALVVLQDALQEQYPSELHLAIKKARTRKKKTNRSVFVMFAPTMERAFRRNAGSREWYSSKAWPFIVSTRPTDSRQTVVPVWSTIDGFEVPSWHRSRTRSS